MDGILRDVPFAFVYLDDILVASHSPREHSQHLRQIFTLLPSNGLVINRPKCIFGVDELDFLGHHVSSRGIAPLAERVSALRNSGAPKDRTSLQRFLGMINYYHRFLPGMQAFWPHFMLKPMARDKILSGLQNVRTLLMERKMPLVVQPCCITLNQTHQQALQWIHQTLPFVHSLSNARVALHGVANSISSLYFS
ncbi:hypothetical protein RRG08_062809 [Elysia crispata]|uniref:Reverse transcriptase domain-containing protein n=1 Tax=Elysia crispata TaxID=231223 RepID=A0AAE0Z1D1_9GAST|nr:hypothetical protein RRG08_062809 [Elysia crispata]